MRLCFLEMSKATPMKSQTLIKMLPIDMLPQKVEKPRGGSLGAQHCKCYPRLGQKIEGWQEGVCEPDVWAATEADSPGVKFTLSPHPLPPHWDVHTARPAACFPLGLRVGRHR